MQHKRRQRDLVGKCERRGRVLLGAAVVIVVGRGRPSVRVLRARVGRTNLVVHLAGLDGTEAVSAAHARSGRTRVLTSTRTWSTAIVRPECTIGAETIDLHSIPDTWSVEMSNRACTT